jgi:hypothetical protein
LRAPAEICEAISTPRAPPSNRSSTLQSSSRTRARHHGGDVGAQALDATPVMNSAMLKA